jgi:hypothetical protein
MFKVSPLVMILRIGHRRLMPLPERVGVIWYTSSAYSTRTPSATSHCPGCGVSDCFVLESSMRRRTLESGWGEVVQDNHLPSRNFIVDSWFTQTSVVWFVEFKAARGASNGKQQ